jgi:alkanesulfonate monooxygenase SsuD/methylene tetrahydromethanopterin reductase-like flavin-dependent oxidoreductase (luciferase family)
MRFAMMIEPQQGLTYQEQLAIARLSEAAGFETLFRSDHYQSFPGPAGLPTTDAWAVLAGLARETERIGLGVLVTPVTFRTAGNLVKVVTTVDEMSGGRVELGLGAGWNDAEHRQHGFPFPDIGERADLLEETGAHIRIDDAIFHPKPVARPGRPRPPIIVGSGGAARSNRLAVAYADELNMSSAGPERVGEVFAALDETARNAGREPASIVHSAMVGVLIGRDTAEVEARARDLIRDIGSDRDAESWLAERRTRWIVGTPDEARAMVDRFAAVGVERLMLQDLLPRDLEMIELLGEVFLG